MSKSDQSEEEILHSLRQVVTGSSLDHHKRRVIGLEELRKRKTIKNTNEATEILLNMTRTVGTSEPESSMIIKILSDLAKIHEHVFEMILDAMKGGENELMFCVLKVIKNLDNEKKKRSVGPLISAWMSKDTFDFWASQIYKALVDIADEEEIIKEIVKSVSPYLKSLDSYKVVYAMKITSKLATKELTPELSLLFNRTLEGYYGSFKEEILTDICIFFGRVEDIRSFPYLLKLLKLGFNRERVTSKALATVIDTYPETMNKIWGFLRKEREHYFPILMAFEDMETCIDIEKLFSIVDIELGNASVKQTTRKIVTKAGSKAKPLLLKMIKSEDEIKYTFALECLKEIGVSIDEISSVFAKTPILQVYDFFYKEKKDLLLYELWQEQERLGKNIKGAQIKRFEHFILNLFSAFNFVTLYVDPAGRQGVDILAFSSERPYLLIIGCTTGILKDDLQQLNVTFKEMKEELKDLFDRYQIIPMVFISKKVDVYPADVEFASMNGLIIFTKDEIQKLLEMLRTGGKSCDVIKFIEKKVSDLEIIRLTKSMI